MFNRWLDRESAWGLVILVAILGAYTAIVMTQSHAASSADPLRAAAATNPAGADR